MINFSYYYELIYELNVHLHYRNVGYFKFI